MLPLTQMYPEANPFRTVRRIYSQSTAGRIASASPMPRLTACWHHVRPKLPQQVETCRPRFARGHVRTGAGKAMVKISNYGAFP